MKHALSIALAAILSAAARAEVTEPPHPLLEYRSVLADYAPHRDAGLADWRALNDEVARLGGHSGHVQGEAGQVHHHGEETAPDRGGMTGHEGHGGGRR